MIIKTHVYSSKNDRKVINKNKKLKLEMIGYWEKNAMNQLE